MNGILRPPAFPSASLSVFLSALIPRALGVVVGVVVGVVAVTPVVGQQAVLIHDGADGNVAIESESLVRVIGIGGTLVLRTARQDGLQYTVRSLRSPSPTDSTDSTNSTNGGPAERPIALWSVGRALELRPLEEAAREPLWLEMAVPPDLVVELEVEDSTVQIAGLRSDIDIRGARLNLEARGIHGVVTLDLDASVVELNGTVADVSVQGRALQLALTRIGGYLTLALHDSRVDATAVDGSLDGTLQNTVLAARGLAAGAHLEARGGSVQLDEVKGELELTLEQAPLGMSSVLGPARVQTDSDVRLDSTQDAVSIQGFGGTIRGAKSNGPVEVNTERAEVVLEEMQGAVRIGGHGLTIFLRDNRGEATVRATSSSVTVEQGTGKLDIETDFGDVHVTETASPLRVVSTEGDVVLTDISGPLELHASGDRVDVSWSEVATDQNQIIENDNGEVTLRFPARSAGRVEVESSFGRVRSELPTVRVSDNERFASGILGRVNRPTIQVKSAGDVLITSHGARGSPPSPAR